MPIERTIIDPLREVADLDAWYELFCCNATADRYSAAQSYLRALYESERHRRKHDAGAGHEYPSADFDSWPDHHLIGAALFAAGAVEFAHLVEKPTIAKWSTEFAKAMTAVVCSRLASRSTATGR